MKTRLRSGFSLMELLAVVAILALLLALSIPAFNSTLRASALNCAGQSVVAHLNLARQVAQSRNRTVEVRFYKLPDYGEKASSTPAVYRAIQSFLLEETHSVPLTKVEYFSAPVVCSENSTESSLLENTLAPEQTPSAGETLPNYGTNYVYRSFYFKPNGRAELSDLKAFVTLVLENDKSLADGANFCTIQLDPVTGRPTVFRP